MCSFYLQGAYNILKKKKKTEHVKLKQRYCLKYKVIVNKTDSTKYTMDGKRRNFLGQVRIASDKDLRLL